MTIMVQTMRALTAPRRAIPLAAVILAMLSAEWVATGRPAALALDLSLLVAFCLLAPSAWRVLGAPRRATKLAALASHCAYLFMAGAVVAGLGVLLPVALGLGWTYVVEPSSVGILFVLFAVGGWGLGRDIELEEGLAEARLRAKRLRLETEQVQLLALRAHLDPHFLFNTLNAIAEWCREDPEVAEAATLKLAALLRTMLSGIRQPSWPLREEIDLLRRVFELYQVRDDQRYRLDLDIPPALPEARVPPMLLLPLFENAITHGPAAGHDGPLELRLATAADRIVVELRNPGRFTERRADGEGIAMAEQRLALAYERGARLSIEADGAATLTMLSLPLQPAHEELS